MPTPIPARAASHPLHWVFWPALAASSAIVLAALRALPWLRTSAEGSVPPGARDGGGLTSWPALALVALVAVCIALIARWDRGQERRHDLLSLAALGLLVLAQLLIAQAALAGARAGAAIPGLAAVDQARWVLPAAAIAGAISLVRIAVVRPRPRGLAFALAALVGAPSTWPILGLLDVARFEPRIDSELELASSPHALPATFDPDEPLAPVLDVLAGGELRLARSLAAQPERLGSAATAEQQARVRRALELLVAALPHRGGVPDVPLVLRIDRAAEFRHVRAALRAAGKSGLRRILLSLERTNHGVLGHLSLVLERPSDGELPPDLDASHVLRLAWQDGVPRFELAGVRISDLPVLAERIGARSGPLRLIPDDDVPWHAVVGSLADLTTPSSPISAWPGAFELGEPD